MAARLSRMSKIMLAITGCLILLVVWTLFLRSPQVEQPIAKPPEIWSSTLPLAADLYPKVEGVVLSVKAFDAGFTADPQALREAQGATRAGESLLLSMTPGPAPSKDPAGRAEALLSWIEAEGLQPSLLLSFDWPLLEALAVRAPDLALGFATSEARLDRKGPSPWLGNRDLTDVEGSLPALVKAAGGSIWAPPLIELRPEDVADAESWGVEVLVVGANQTEAFPSLLLLRPLALVTDKPAALSQAIVERPGLFAVGSALE